MTLIVRRGSSASLLTLHLDGEVDVATAPLLADHLGASLQLCPLRLAIDARDLCFLGSAGIHVLRKTTLEIAPVMPPMLFLHPQRPVRRVLSLTGATTWLEVPADDPQPGTIDVSSLDLLRRLDVARALVADAVDACDVLRWERARLDFAAVAFSTVEALAARGLVAPVGLRAEAEDILRKAEGTRP